MILDVARTSNSQTTDLSSSRKHYGFHWTLQTGSDIGGPSHVLKYNLVTSFSLISWLLVVVFRQCANHYTTYAPWCHHPTLAYLSMQFLDWYQWCQYSQYTHIQALLNEGWFRKGLKLHLLYCVSMVRLRDVCSMRLCTNTLLAKMCLLLNTCVCHTVPYTPLNVARLQAP